MKSVLISIRPRWVELIVNGIKTIEVRKTSPDDEPFKANIYCTSVKSIPLDEYVLLHRRTNGRIDYWHGKVIGEFICDRIDKYVYYAELPYDKYNLPKNVLKDMCLTCHDVDVYGAGKMLRGWHISDLQIYDTPRELSEFGKGCNDRYDPMYGSYCGDCDKRCRITRPPQSWQFAEEMTRLANIANL